MTASDPLHTVTDSATAFEDRLRCADDVELTPAQAAARVAHGHEEQFLNEHHHAQARRVWDATVERMHANDQDQEMRS